MAQRKKKFIKRKGRRGGKEAEEESDFELVTEDRGEEDPNSCRMLPHFPAATDGGLSDVEPDTRQLVRCQNKKKKKSGGFQSMGYKVPTPIQRKTIPVILDGKDIVAMARTGSAKGPAGHGGPGAHPHPTRELALQTMKFTKELGRFTGLKIALILGGDGIIGTPGRLMHVILQMNLKLQSVEYVVLFEMGFAEQLQEIIRRLPDNRQSLLFSATLPKLLLSFFYLRMDDKPALLLHLLRNVFKPQEQTVVFVATKYHVEYLKELLTMEGVECAYIYSALDQTARKINIGKFVHRRAMVLIVTDVAARGIDIPLLDNVVNFNFPSKAKLFLHRVGRVARAGRSGVSYSLVCPDEVPFVYDLHLFLGRPLQLATPQHAADSDGVFGRVPQCLLDDEGSQLTAAHQNSLDLSNIQRVSENAYKQYLKSRPSPSPESIKRVKNTDMSNQAVHPMLESIKRVKNTDMSSMARSRDAKLVEKFSRKREERATEDRLLHPAPAAAAAGTVEVRGLDDDDSEEDEEMLQDVFSEVVGGKRRRPAQDGEDADKQRVKKSKAGGKDEEYYVPLSLGAEGTMFDQQATSAVLDMMGDEGESLNQHNRIMKWDRKKKRFVKDTGKEDQKKKVRLETGRGRGRGGRNQSFRSPGGPQLTPGGQRVRSELKTSGEILKERRKQQKHQFLQSGGLQSLRQAGRGRSGSRGGGGGGHKSSFSGGRGGGRGNKGKRR
ncbi:hypothetical protein CRUP_008303 [Coryphaenoides rupestris]|nr:hypothetical protein CRUP_008303 [Coryphaenoides rupestris]